MWHHHGINILLTEHQNCDAKCIIPMIMVISVKIIAFFFLLTIFCII